jgi:hypothetical protein
VGILYLYRFVGTDEGKVNVVSTTDGQAIWVVQVGVVLADTEPGQITVWDKLSQRELATATVANANA